MSFTKKTSGNSSSDSKQLSGEERTESKVTTWPYAGTLDYPPHVVEYLEARGALLAAKMAGARYLTKAEAKAAKLTPAESKKPSDGLAFRNGKLGQIRFLDAFAKPKIQSAYGHINCFYEPKHGPDIEYDYPIIRSEAKWTVYIVEGPLKALVCAWHRLIALGLNGTYGWMSDGAPIESFDDWEWLERVVILCFDSDTLSKWQVRQALKKLGLHLKSLGANVKIKIIPSVENKVVGADDYIAAHGAKAFRKLANFSIDDPKFADWDAPQYVQELNREIAFLMHGGKALTLSATPDAEHGGFDINFANVREQAHNYANRILTVTDPATQKKKELLIFSLWMRSEKRRQIRKVVMNPAGEPGYNPNTGDFNLWQGFAIKPHKPDDEHSWALLEKHIHEVIANGNPNHAEYILNWLAFCLQFPALLPKVALVLLGEQGVGKGTLFNAILKIFGRHGVQVYKREQLTGKHNNHLRDALFVFADEATYGGDKDTIGAINSFITEETNMIEPKFVDALAVKNFKKIGMSSNEDWVVPAGIDARRYAIFSVSSKHANKKPYFDAINAELKSGGYEAMLYDLQHRDVKDFNVLAFPKTRALFEQKKLSFNETTIWWFEKLIDGDPKWTDKGLELDREDVYEEIRKRTVVNYDAKQLKIKIGIHLKKVCPKKTDGRRTVETKITDKALRGRTYVFPSLEKCRAAFEKALKLDKGSIDWETGNYREEFDDVDA